MVKTFQISEKVKPHPVVVNILTKMEDIIPKWKIVPTKDVIDSAFKDPSKREEVKTPCFTSSKISELDHRNEALWQLNEDYGVLDS